MTDMKRISLAMLFFAATLPLAAGGRKPAWVTGPDTKYPETKFATGVGIGGDLDAARSNARGEIARTFQARVQQTLIDQQTESSTSIGRKRSAALGTQKSQSETQLTTDTLLEGVSIAETFYQKKTKKHYALAVLDKLALRRSLTGQILDKEQAISAATSRANTATSPVERAHALSEALDAAQERDTLSTRRRVVDPAGMAELPGRSSSDLENALEKTISSIPISVEASGPEDSNLRATVVAAVNDEGVSVSNGNTTGLALTTTLEVTPFDRGLPEWSFFQWSGSVELTDLSTGKVVASASPDGVEGHLTEKTARSKTMNAGEKALAQDAARLLSSYLFGQ